MNGVKSLCLRFCEMQHFHGNGGQAVLLEALDNFADEIFPHTIGLDDG